jgi:hypothetical protein
VVKNELWEALLVAERDAALSNTYGTYGGPYNNMGHHFI